MESVYVRSGLEVRSWSYPVEELRTNNPTRHSTHADAVCIHVIEYVGLYGTWSLHKHVCCNTYRMMIDVDTWNKVSLEY